MGDTRRSVLAGSGTTLGALLAGCSSVPSLGGESCRIFHKIYSGGRERQIVAGYEYTTLSTTAQTVFDDAFENRGTISSVQRPPGGPPSEFHYSDVLTYFEIEYEGAVYELATWTKQGC